MHFNNGWPAEHQPAPSLRAQTRPSPTRPAELNSKTKTLTQSHRTVWRLNQGTPGPQIGRHPVLDYGPKLQDATIVAVGLDGCRAGWIAALGLIRGEGTPSTGLQLFTNIKDAAEWRAREYPTATVAIDVPIGLPDLVGLRPCDRNARQRLGARWMSVFEPPDRELFGRDFDEARTIVQARRQTDPAGTFHVLTRQAIEIMAKIAEVDRFVAEHPDCEPWLIEVHPEVSFGELAGNVLPRKKTAAGKEARLALLTPIFPDVAETMRLAPWTRRDVGRDDMLDAHAALWSALRFVRGPDHYIQLGNGERDAHGLPMRTIV